MFRGTRVPVVALVGNLEAGLTLDDFLDNLPTVTREQAIAVPRVLSSDDQEARPRGLKVLLDEDARHVPSNRGLGRREAAP